MKLDPKEIRSGRYRLGSAIDSAGVLMREGLELDIVRSDEAGRWVLCATIGGARIALVHGYKDAWALAGGILAEAILSTLENIPAAPTRPDPTPRERGQQTCRAALMTVIGLHRTGIPDHCPEVQAEIGRVVVAATLALMDLDGLRENAT